MESCCWCWLAGFHRVLQGLADAELSDGALSWGEADGLWNDGLFAGGAFKDGAGPDHVAAGPVDEGDSGITACFAVFGAGVGQRKNCGTALVCNEVSFDGVCRAPIHVWIGGVGWGPGLFWLDGCQGCGARCPGGLRRQTVRAGVRCHGGGLGGAGLRCIVGRGATGSQYQGGAENRGERRGAGGGVRNPGGGVLHMNQCSEFVTGVSRDEIRGHFAGIRDEWWVISVCSW